MSRYTVTYTYVSEDIVEDRIELEIEEYPFLFPVRSEHPDLEDLYDDEWIGEYLRHIATTDEFKRMINYIKIEIEGKTGRSYPTGQIPLTFDMPFNWEDDIDPDNFHELLTDMISNIFNEDDDNAEDEDLINYNPNANDEDDDEDPVEIAINIPKPTQQRDPPKFSSSSMEALQDDRIKQAINTVRQMKKDDESTTTIRSTYRNNDVPTEFAAYSAVKIRPDVHLTIIDKGGPKKATVSVFTKN